MTFWTHVLRSNFTGKNAHQDSNSPVNAAEYIRKQICIHSHERLHQEPIAKRQSGDAGVQLHTVLGQIRYNFKFGVSSPDPGGTTHISARNPWLRDQVTFCIHSPSHHSRSPISQIIVDFHLPHKEQPMVGAVQDCCPFDSSQASDRLKTLAEVPTNPTRGHPPQLWVGSPQWKPGGVVAVGLWWHTDVHQRLSPSFPSALSQLHKSFHVCSLLGYPSWYYSRDTTALKESPRGSFCTSLHIWWRIQSPEISEHVKEVILRHFC